MHNIYKYIHRHKQNRGLTFHSIQNLGLNLSMANDDTQSEYVRMHTMKGERILLIFLLRSPFFSFDKFWGHPFLEGISPQYPPTNQEFNLQYPSIKSGRGAKLEIFGNVNKIIGITYRFFCFLCYHLQLIFSLFLMKMCVIKVLVNFFCEMLINFPLSFLLVLERCLWITLELFFIGCCRHFFAWHVGERSPCFAIHQLISSLFCGISTCDILKRFNL